MASERQNFELHAGDTLDVIFTVLDDADLPKDISGFTVEWAMQLLEDDIPITKSTIDGGISISDGPNGQFTVHLLPADTEGFTRGLYQHQARVIDPFNAKVTVTRGHCNLLASLIPVSS